MRRSRGLIVVLGVVGLLGVLFFLRSMEIKGILPAVQPATQDSAEVWTRVTAAHLPIFIYADGRLESYIVLSTGDKMRVLGQNQGVLVVGLDDGRKAVVVPVIDGVPTTDLGEGWKALPQVSFP